MAILHLVFHAPRGRDAPAWLGRLGPGDAVLLLGDALHGVRANGLWRPLLRPTEATRFYALNDDLRRRGIAAPDGVNPLDDAGFVALAIEYETSVTWS